jgi:hypothetical protein
MGSQRLRQPYAAGGRAGKGNSHFWLRLGFQNINTLERDLKKRSNKS